MADPIDSIEGIRGDAVAVVAEPPHSAANASSGSPSKRARAEGQDLGLAWITASLAGAVVIFGFTVAGLAHWSASVTPVLFMGGYLWFAMGRSRRSIQRIADSVYFMGFWWTLWALLVTLVWYGLSLEPKTVFQAFGYALVTTAAGMFVRMSLLQFNRTLDDQEIEALDSIDERIGLLRTALDGVNGTVAASGRQLQRDLGLIEAAVGAASNAISQSVQRFVEGTNKTLTDQTQKFSQTTQIEITAMLSSLTELRKATGRIQKSVEKHGNDLDSSVGALTTSLLSSSQRSKDAMDGLLGKIDLIEAPADLIDRKLKTLTSGVEASLAVTRQQLDMTTSSLAHLETAAGKSLSALTQLPESIRAIDAALDAAARHLATLTEGAVGRVNADLASLTDDIRTAKQSLGTVATGVNEMIKFVDSRLR
jgi:hypothetical protein